MNKKRIKPVWGVAVLVLGIALLGYMTGRPALHPTWAPGSLWPTAAESDHIDGQEYKIMAGDQQNQQILSKMSRAVAVGDELIMDTGRRYQVKSVSGFHAQAEFVGLDRELLAYRDQFNQQTLPVAATGQQNKQNSWSNRPIAIYHTHSAESYVPTDGSESKPYHGGIFQVGDALAEALEKKGVKVLHDKTPHEPRDKNAYYRSRRTAGELIRKNPVTILDVHRDGIPDPNYYSKTVDGQGITQIRLVVGRQNPKMQSNMEFAKKMMAYGNKVHPGLVKEIFMAHGNYNQDLMSTAMLLEMGTHTNSGKAAQRSAALMADVLPGLLGVGGGAAAPGGFGSGTGSPAGWKTLAWILGLTVLGGGAFLIISSGNLANAKKRLGGFMSREMGGLAGPAKKRMDGDPNQDQQDHDPGQGKG